MVLFEQVSGRTPSRMRCKAKHRPVSPETNLLHMAVIQATRPVSMQLVYQASRGEDDYVLFPP